MKHSRYVPLLAVGIALVAVGIAFLANHLAGQSRPPAHEELRQFAESYFRVWSEGDIAAYQSHFDESARIIYVEGGRVVQAMDRDPFVAGQAEILAAAQVPMVERMTSLTAEADEMGAQVTAQWSLEKGRETQTGVDRFTLVRNRQGEWKIVFLMFYPRKS